MKRSLICMGIGAGLMYLFDPELGETRRALLRDKFQGAMPQTQEALSSKAEAVVAKATELTEIADTAAAEKIDSLGGDAMNADESTGKKAAAK